MIKRPDCLMSDNGKYCIMGNEGMIKNIYDGDRVLFKLGIYDKPVDDELIKFMKDLEIYFYGGNKDVAITHKGKDTKDLLRDLNL